MAEEGLRAALTPPQAKILYDVGQSMQEKGGAGLEGVILDAAAVDARAARAGLEAARAGLEAPPEVPAAGPHGVRIAVSPDPKNVANLVAALRELRGIPKRSPMQDTKLDSLAEAGHGIVAVYPDTEGDTEGDPPLIFECQLNTSPRPYKELAEGCTNMRVGDVYFPPALSDIRPLEGSFTFPVASLGVVSATASDPGTVQAAWALQQFIDDQQPPDTARQPRSAAPTPGTRTSRRGDRRAPGAGSGGQTRGRAIGT